MWWQAALDYIEGWCEGDAVRMERALHKELAKRTIFPGAGTEQFVNLTKTQMVEATRKGGGKARPADTRNIKVEILDLYRDIAGVQTECADYIDYLHLARSEGQWRIVNALWQSYVKERKEVALDPLHITWYQKSRNVSRVESGRDIPQNRQHSESKELRALPRAPRAEVVRA